MRETLSDKAYAAIKAAIITCEFEPGQQIAQPHLAERFGIGETPVREALHRLAQEGFVESVPRYGYVVTPISYSTVVDIYEVRLIVESATARMAAIRGQMDDLERIVSDQEFDYSANDRESYLHFVSRNSALHCQVAEASGNAYLVDIVAKLHAESTRVFHLGLHMEEGVEEMRQEHIAIATAIRDREADHAENLIHGHIVRSQNRVLDALSQHFGIRRADPSADVLPTRPGENTLHLRLER